jgi:putative nucleotidyltransferase with HDIG domain
MQPPILWKADSVFKALEATRPLVAAHSRRVSTYAVRLARHYGLSSDAIETIRLGALLHDVGKMLVPLHILEKPDRLDESEWSELRMHPDIGIELLGHAAFAQEVCEVVLCHHEWHDGRGYPDGLSGPAIKWPVRIVSVMDSFDALTSARGYRERLSVEQARALIAREAGTRFCPWVVSGLLSLPSALLTQASDDGAVPFVPDGCAAGAVLGPMLGWHSHAG